VTKKIYEKSPREYRMPDKASKEMSIPSIKARAHEIWELSVSRSYNKNAATGQVVIKSPHRPNPKNPQHLILAGARAWHTLGVQLLGDGDATGATQCAQSGVVELGKDYALDGVCDDTGLKIHAAEDLIEQGRGSDGARLILRMLEIRLDLYKQLHKDEIFE
jgi:hypothetical protein